MFLCEVCRASTPGAPEHQRHTRREREMRGKNALLAQKKSTEAELHAVAQRLESLNADIARAEAQESEEETRRAILLRTLETVTHVVEQAEGAPHVGTEWANTEDLLNDLYQFIAFKCCGTLLDRFDPKLYSDLKRYLKKG